MKKFGGIGIMLYFCNGYRFCVTNKNNNFFFTKHFDFIPLLL